jgi:hypothetical protein
MDRTRNVVCIPLLFPGDYLITNGQNTTEIKLAVFTKHQDTVAISKIFANLGNTTYKLTHDMKPYMYKRRIYY